MSEQNGITSLPPEFRSKSEILEYKRKKLRLILEALEIRPIDFKEYGISGSSVDNYIYGRNDKGVKTLTDFPEVEVYNIIDQIIDKRMEEADERECKRIKYTLECADEIHSEMPNLEMWFFGTTDMVTKYAKSIEVTEQHNIFRYLKSCEDFNFAILLSLLKNDVKKILLKKLQDKDLNCKGLDFLGIVTKRSLLCSPIFCKTCPGCFQKELKINAKFAYHTSYSKEHGYHINEIVEENYDIYTIALLEAIQSFQQLDADILFLQSMYVLLDKAATYENITRPLLDDSNNFKQSDRKTGELIKIIKSIYKAEIESKKAVEV